MYTAKPIGSFCWSRIQKYTLVVTDVCRCGGLFIANPCAARRCGLWPVHGRVLVEHMWQRRFMQIYGCRFYIYILYIFGVKYSSNLRSKTQRLGANQAFCATPFSENWNTCLLYKRPTWVSKICRKNKDCAVSHIWWPFRICKSGQNFK